MTHLHLQSLVEVPGSTTYQGLAKFWPQVLLHSTEDSSLLRSVQWFLKDVCSFIFLSFLFIFVQGATSRYSKIKNSRSCWLRAWVKASRRCISSRECVPSAWVSWKVGEQSTGEMSPTDIDYRCDNRRFWLSAHNCQVPTPTSQNLEHRTRTANSDFWSRLTH